MGNANCPFLTCTTALGTTKPPANTPSLLPNPSTSTGNTDEIPLGTPYWTKHTDPAVLAEKRLSDSGNHRPSVYQTLHLDSPSTLPPPDSVPPDIHTLYPAGWSIPLSLTFLHLWFGHSPQGTSRMPVRVGSDATGATTTAFVPTGSASSPQEVLTNVRCLFWASIRAKTYSSGNII
ncbi:hypothetical protein DPEC_G00375430 [Dallia pectoralis]|nr:hypothetical protein DPEC_G00375430 [Dallia pectoralis]